MSTSHRPDADRWARLSEPCAQCPHDYGDHGAWGGACAEEDCERFTEAATPCLVCGAPIIENRGHDAGCMVAGPIAAYIADIRRDIEAAGL